MSNLTEWFPPEIKPAYPGVYNTGIDTQYQRYWDGKDWSHPAHIRDTKHVRQKLFSEKSEYGRLVRWRGLAEPPVTDWFPGNVKPVHVGDYECVYEDDDSTTRRFRYWNGEYWSCVFRKNDTEKDKIYFRSKRAIFEIDKWRGLQVNVCPQ